MYLESLKAACFTKLKSQTCINVKETLSEDEAKKKLLSCSANEVCESILSNPRDYLKACETGVLNAREDVGAEIGSFVFDIFHGKDPRASCIENKDFQKFLVEDFNKNLPACLHQRPNPATIEHRNCEQITDLLHEMLKHSVDQFKFKGGQGAKLQQDACYKEWAKSQSVVGMKLNLDWKQMKEKWSTFGDAVSKSLDELSAMASCYKPEETRRLMCYGGAVLVSDLLLGKGKNSVAKVLKMAGQAEKRVEVVKDTAARPMKKTPTDDRRQAQVAARRVRLRKLREDPQTREAESSRRWALEAQVTSAEGLAAIKRYPEQLRDLITQNSGMRVLKVTEIPRIRDLEEKLSYYDQRFEKLSRDKAPRFILDDVQKTRDRLAKEIEQLKKFPRSDFEIEIDLDSSPMLKAMRDKWGLKGVRIDSKLDGTNTNGSFDPETGILRLNPETVFRVGGDLRLSSTLYHEFHHAMVAKRIKNLRENMRTISGYLYDGADTRFYNGGLYLDELGAHHLSGVLTDRGYDTSFTDGILKGGAKASGLVELSQRSLKAIDLIEKEKAWAKAKVIGKSQVMLPFDGGKHMIIDVMKADQLAPDKLEVAIQKRLAQIKEFAETTSQMGQQALAERGDLYRRILEATQNDSW